MKRLAIAGVCAVMLAGSHRLPDIVQAPALDAYQGQPLTLIVHKKASFLAMTSGKAAFAMFGALAALSEGDKVVKDNNIADPAGAIADRIGTELAGRLKTPAPVTVSEFDEDSNTDIAKAAGGKGLAFYVEAVGWGFSYYSTSWGHYHVNYDARMRLVDAATGQTIAQAPCKYETGEDGAPDYDTMMADNAAFIKKVMASAADSCVAVVEDKMLGIAPAAPAPDAPPKS